MTSLDLRLCVTDSPVGDYPEKIKCREHPDKVQSMAVYHDHIHCYGCGFREGCGDPIYGLAYLLRIPLDQARAAAEKYTTERLDAYRERAAQEARRDPLPRSLSTLYHETLMRGRRRNRRDWLLARGLTDDTIARFEIGHDGLRFTIPIFDADGNLISIRFRRDDQFGDEGSKYLGIKGRNGLYLFPEFVGLDSDTLYLCEGELDAIRLWQEGLPAVTLTNGAGQTPKLPRIIKEKYPRVTSLIIATDLDEPGQEAARLTKEAAIAAGFKDVTRLEWSEGKDVTEAYQLGASWSLR